MLFMSDYEKLYHKTFNAMTDAERLMQQAAKILRMVQLECEDIYMEMESKSQSNAPSNDK